MASSSSSSSRSLPSPPPGPVPRGALHLAGVASSSAHPRPLRRDMTKGTAQLVRKSSSSSSEHRRPLRRRRSRAEEEPRRHRSGNGGEPMIIRSEVHRVQHESRDRHRPRRRRDMQPRLGAHHRDHRGMTASGERKRPRSLSPPPPAARGGGAEDHRKRRRQARRCPTPPPVFVVISRMSSGLQSSEDFLQKAIIVTPAKPGDVMPPPGEALQALAAQHDISLTLTTIHRYPVGYLVVLPSPEDAQRVLTAGPRLVTGPSGFTLLLEPWTRRAMAIPCAAGWPPLRYVEVSITGLPAHAWEVSTAEAVVSHACWIERLCDTTASRSDVTEFRFRAWTYSPERIPEPGTGSPEAPPDRDALISHPVKIRVQMLQGHA